MSRIIAFILLCSFSLYAIDGGVSVEIKSKQKYHIGEEIVLKVDIKTTAYSMTDSNIGLDTNSNYIVVAPNSSSSLESVEVNGTSWQVIHYEYLIYPLHYGELQIPPIDISFNASMGYGQPKKEFKLQSKALDINISKIAGAKDGEFVLVSDKYSLEFNVKPKESKLIIGDAIEIEVIQKAKNSHDILLQPIVYKSTNYFTIYPKEPILKSKLGSDFDVSRADRFTLIAKREGNTTLIGKTLFWWNRGMDIAKEEIVPDIKLEIIVDPQIAVDEKKAKTQKTILYTFISILLLLLIYKNFREILIKNGILKETVLIEELNPK